MSTVPKPLQELVQELPPDMLAEVRDYIESLLARKGRGEKRALRQDWAGALRDYREQYTSLELQRQAGDFDRTVRKRQTPAEALEEP